MTLKDRILSKPKRTVSIAVAVAAMAIGGGTYGIVSATTNTSWPFSRREVQITFLRPMHRRNWSEQWPPHQ